MTVIAISVLNIVLYGYVTVRAIRFFYDGGYHCRDSDKIIISGVGAVALLFVIAQLTMLLVYPGQQSRGVELLYGFVFTKGVIDLTIIQVTLRSAHRRSNECSTKRERS